MVAAQRELGNAEHIELLRPTLTKTFWGGEADLTDGQWRDFRSNVALLGAIGVLSTSLTQLMFRVVFRYIPSERWRTVWATTQRCLFAFAFAVVIHRFQLLILIGVLLLHYGVVKLLIGRTLFGINVALLFSWSYCLIGIFVADTNFLRYYSNMFGLSYVFMVSY